jgi:hypothetical protein
MKLLKIECNAGHFLTAEGGYAPVDKLTKEDLLRLVDLTLGDDVELDGFDEEALPNQAHQIIYKSVCEKLRDLRDRRQGFTDESERLYLHEYEKYRSGASQQQDARDGLRRR